MKEAELLTLLKEFKPYEFDEENYVNSPPIVPIERFNNQDLVVVAMNNKGVEILDKLSLNNYLKKIDKEVYLIDRFPIVDALNKFSWLVRMGWRDERVHYLWCLLNSCIRADEYDSLSSIIVEDFNTQLEVCLRKLGMTLPQDYSMMLNLLQTRLSEYISRIPPAIHQKVIDYLCSYGESTVDELFRRVLRGGVSVSTLYKALSRLKKENYVKVVKHVRISSKGPMRELLTSNCSNCLYNHSSFINCYKYNLNQLSAIFKAFYGKTISPKDLEKLYIEFRSIPYPQRVVRRINEILLSLHSIKTKLEDRLTNSILSKIQNITGINLIS
ncbi:MAG: hypothetical protein N3G77_05780 [Nitrososphaeria archaeon]|nr:hypothetical protein [Nitrososphaeria archaeon]